MSAARDELVASDVVGPWEPGLVPLCNPEPFDPCDCGFVGMWERRWVMVWHDHPGHKRTDYAVRRDLAAGRSPRPQDEGWWVFGGWDERCPGCGDIERFDYDGERVNCTAEHAKVVIAMDAWRNPS